MKDSGGKYQSGNEVFAEYIPNYRRSEAYENSRTEHKVDVDEIVNNLLSHLRKQLVRIKPKQGRKT